MKRIKLIFLLSIILSITKAIPPKNCKTNDDCEGDSHDCMHGHCEYRHVEPHREWCTTTDDCRKDFICTEEGHCVHKHLKYVLGTIVAIWLNCCCCMIFWFIKREILDKHEKRK